MKVWWYFGVVLSLVFATVINAQAQSFVWAQGFVATGSTAGAGIGSIAIDANNLFVIGDISGTVDVDQSSNVHNVISVGHGAVFLVKKDLSGNFQWVKEFQCKSASDFGFTGPVGIAIDTTGNIYLAGSFYDTIDVDPGPNTFYMGAASLHPNIYVIKLNPSGDLVWAKQIGGGNNISALGWRAMKIDNTGVYLIAAFGGTIDVDPGALVVNLTPVGAANAMLIEKLDTAGHFMWAKQINGAGTLGLALDSNSNLYFTGAFKDTVDFDPGVGVSKLFSGSSSGNAIFVGKYDSLGNFLWVKQIGVSGNSALSQGIAVDCFGNVVVVGYYNSIMDFDPGSGIYNITATSRDMFVLRLRNNGDFSWVKSIHPAANDDARAVTTDGQGNVYTTGEFFSAADFDPGPGVHMLTGGVYVQKLDSTGNYVWAVDWEADIPGWIGLDHSNNVYTTGVFTGTNRDFDPGSGTFLLSGYSGSGFILKLTQQSIIDNIEEHEHFQQGVKVYPNPSTGSLTFSSSEKIDLITITDLQGKVVFTYSPNNIKTTVNLSQLSSGMYFYTLTHGQKRLNGNFIIETTR